MGLGLWTAEIRNRIIADGGSVQNVDEIPQDLKDIYKTVWEVKQRSLIDMAADRGAFIDQVIACVSLLFLDSSNSTACRVKASMFSLQSLIMRS